MKKGIRCGYCQAEVREGAIECSSCKKKFRQKRTFRQGLILLMVLLGSIFLLNFIDVSLSSRSKLFTIGFLWLSLIKTFLGFFFLFLFALIPAVIILAFSYGIIRVVVKSAGERKIAFKIIAISVIFGIFIIPTLYSPIETMGISGLFYPSFVLDSFKFGSDNWVPSTLALLVYGIFIGLVVGIIASIIYYTRKNGK